MNAVFSGATHAAIGANHKPNVSFTGPVGIDRLGARLSRDEERDGLGGDTNCERTAYLHGDCDGGMGTEPMVRKLVWPWSLICFGCEDVDEYFSRSHDRRFRKVTRAQVDEIRARVATGERQKDIAGDYNMTAANINKIVRNKAWVR